MILYTLDEDLNPDLVIEEFDSFIWTERYSTHGDFSLSCVDTQRMRDQIRKGTLLGHSETDWGMIVETRTRSTDDNGKKILKISGRSFSLLLSRRVLGPDANASELFLAGKPGTTVTNMVEPFTREGSRVSSDDLISNMVVKDSTTLAKQVAVALSWGSLYDSVKSMCDAHDLGFKITIDEKPGTYRFDVYEGTVLDNVEFGEFLDNFKNTNEVESDTNYANVCYVRTKDASTVSAVSMKDDNIHIRGLNRRVIFIDASDIDPSNYNDLTDFTKVVQQRGREELAKHQAVNAIDGTVSPESTYTYKVDFDLGDIVQVFGTTKETISYNRVTEYIWAWDGEGLRSYPTLQSTSKDYE